MGPLTISYLHIQPLLPRSVARARPLRLQGCLIRAEKIGEQPIAERSAVPGPGFS